MTEKDLERFESKVDREPGHGPAGDCHQWTKGVDTYGYGQFWLEGRNRVAPHIAWLMAYGPRKPCDLSVLHQCDNRRCVNPAHLYLGTQADNMADRTRRQRHAFGERQGLSKLTDQQVAEIKGLLGTLSQQAIAARYGVHQTSISLIKRGVTWRHVAAIEVATPL